MAFAVLYVAETPSLQTHRPVIQPSSTRAMLFYRVTPPSLLAISTSQCWHRSRQTVRTRTSICRLSPMLQRRPGLELPSKRSECSWISAPQQARAVSNVKALPVHTVVHTEQSLVTACSPVHSKSNFSPVTHDLNEKHRTLNPDKGLNNQLNETSSE